MIELSLDDWAEIYYALGTKRMLIEQGHYKPGEPGEDEQWAAHLKEIEDKIGGDGMAAAMDGVAPCGGLRKRPPRRRR